MTEERGAVPWVPALIGFLSEGAFVEELIPESQSGNETDFSTIGAMLGFATMMLLYVALS